MALQLKDLGDELVASINKYSNASGQCGLEQRNKIKALAKQIISEVQDPGELTWDYGSSMVEVAVLRQFMEWRVLENVPETGTISYTNLAAKVDITESLLKRMAWILVATGVLNQIGEDEVAHTKFSRIFMNSNPQAVYFKIMWDYATVPYTRWTDYFNKYGRKEPTMPSHNPISFTYGKEEMSFWEILSPEQLVDVNIAMQNLDEVIPVNGMFPFKSLVENAHLVEPDAPLVVDVGGGRGQALMRMREECPDIPPERMVLQDRAMVIEEVEKLNAPELRNVKKMVIDFFTEQPIKGALVYYLRRIMHDWNDEDDCKILNHIKNAMGPHSRILITDQIMPCPPTSLAAQTDLVMINLGAKERTEKAWLALIAKANLEVVKIWRAAATEVAVFECKKE